MRLRALTGRELQKSNTKSKLHAAPRSLNDLEEGDENQKSVQGYELEDDSETPRSTLLEETTTSSEWSKDTCSVDGEKKARVSNGMRLSNPIGEISAWMFARTDEE